MPDRFVPLDEFLCRSFEAERDIEAVEAVVVQSEIDVRPPAREAAADVRRFRAAVRDAVDVAVRDVLLDVAAEVLARELELAPANIDAIVMRACARHAGENVVSVRVHPDELAALAQTEIAALPDNALRLGDVLLEVRSGTIDATLGARLADVLDNIEA